MSARGTKELCCTCLSKNRKVFQLCRIPDGVNLLFSLLSCDVDAFREGFYKDPGSWLVCWECRASVRKLKLFQLQACTALKRLTEIIRHSSIQEAEINGISQLSINSLPSLELLSKDFIDCGSVPSNHTKENHDKYHKVENKDFGDEEAMVSIKYKNEVQNENEELFEDEVLNTENELSDKVDVNNQNEVIETGVADLDNEAQTIKKAKKNPIHTVKKRIKNDLKLDKALKYPCAECDMIFDNKGAKWKHVQKCHREGHKCHTCDKVFSFKHNLKRHRLSHQSGHPRVECPTCLKSVRVSLLATHARTHAHRDRLCCTPCDKEFVCRATYESHLKYALAHAGPGSQVYRYKCESCDKQFRSRGELADHRALRHDARARHACPVCHKLLATRRCVRRHVRRAHEGLRERVRDLMCHHCGLTFRDGASLREHEWRHTGARPLACAQCGRAFRQRAALTKHARTLHDKPSQA